MKLARSSANLSVGASSLDRRGIRAKAHACQLSIKSSRKHWKVLEIDVCYFRRSPRQQNHFPFIELTQSNQPSSHLSDFALIELIIFRTTHSHTRAGCETQSCAKRTNRKFLSDGFCCFFSCSSSRRLFPLRRRAFVPSPEKVDEQNLIQSILMPSLHFPQSKNAFEVRGRNWLTKGSGLLFKLNRSDSILDRSEG